MEVFGYEKRVSDDDAEGRAVMLSECSLLVTPAEIDLLIGFLQHAKERFAARDPIPCQAHEHFSMWNRQWPRSQPDFIVIYDDEDARLKRGA